MHRVVLHTFQRTGRNFILNAIKDISDIWIDSSQSSDIVNYKGYDNIITIVRDPVDSIVSLSLMASRNHPDQDFKSNIHASQTAWINFHKDINLENSVYLDFKELEINAESFIKKIIDIAKIDQIGEYSEARLNGIMKEYEDRHRYGFIISEKDSPDYQRVKDYVLSLDLSEHKGIYDILIKRCV
jgi:hypothetical protein